jgi:Lysyl oxidase
MKSRRRALLIVSVVAVMGGSWPVARATSQPGMPDLIVDQASLRQHWVVRTENLPAEFCSVQEGDITPGEHQLVRFTVATPNIGDADLVVGDPNQHVGDGLFEFASCHEHYHFRHYALYELVDPNTGTIWKAAKRGFCMIDIERFKQYSGEVDNKRHFASCGAIGIPGNQGISKGWSDIYVWKLGGQYFLLDGGDGQPPVPPGNYLIRITVNPAFVAEAGEPCPNQDLKGLCHTLPESDYENNVAQVSITIPDHNGRKAVGPLKDEPALASEPIDGK